MSADSPVLRVTPAPLKLQRAKVPPLTAVPTVFANVPLKQRMLPRFVAPAGRPETIWSLAAFSAIAAGPGLSSWTCTTKRVRKPTAGGLRPET